MPWSHTCLRVRNKANSSYKFILAHILICRTGAAIAVEDGVALARSLSYMKSREQLPTALDVFQKVRLKRAGQMQEASLLNGQLWHFADGPLQEARDAAMVPEVKGIPFSHSPNQWSDPATQMWCYSYDAEREIDAAWVKARAQQNSSVL